MMGQESLFAMGPTNAVVRALGCQTRRGSQSTQIALIALTRLAQRLDLVVSFMTTQVRMLGPSGPRVLTHQLDSKKELEKALKVGT
jgi:hypothetical protein